MLSGTESEKDDGEVEDSENSSSVTSSETAANQPTIVRTKHGKAMRVHIMSSLNSLANFNSKMQRLWQQEESQEKLEKSKNQKGKHYAQTDAKQHS